MKLLMVSISINMILFTVFTKKISGVCIFEIFKGNMM